MEHLLSNYKPKNNSELLKKVYKDFLNYHRSMYWGNAPTSEFPGSIWKANLSLKDKLDILYTDFNLKDRFSDKDVRSVYAEVTPPTGTEHRPTNFNSFLMRMSDEILDKLIRRNISVSDDVVKLLLDRSGFQFDMTQSVNHKNHEWTKKILDHECKDYNKYDNKTKKAHNHNYCESANMKLQQLVIASSDNELLGSILNDKCKTHSKSLWCFLNDYVEYLKGNIENFDRKFRKNEYTHFTPVSKESKNVTKKEFITLLKNKVIIQHLRDTMNTKKRKKIIKKLTELSPKFAKSFKSSQKGGGKYCKECGRPL